MKPNEPLTTENLNTILQTLLASQGKSHPVMDLLQKQMEEADAERQLRRKEQLESKRQNSLAMERQRQLELQAQEACPHLKPNGMPNIAGQRDHSNNYHYICQRCFKPWTNNLPGHLQISHEFVGGPQI